VNVEIVPVKEADKSVLRQLMELYSHDFSEFTGEDVDEHGFYGYSYLDHYWAEDGRYPFFIKVDGKIAGFALVRKSCGDYSASESVCNIAEFFVMRKYRRMNVGGVAAKCVFELFKGEWEVRVLHVNVPALPFWRKVIDEYTGGNYVYHSEPVADWDGVGYTFLVN
jgi:predicted acetyltransferase